jgi:hypothetical protein
MATELAVSIPAVGSKVTVTFLASDATPGAAATVVTGTLACAEALLVVSLFTAPSPGNPVRAAGSVIIPRNRVTAIETLSAPTTPFALSEVSADAASRKYEAAVRARAAEAAKINADVPEAAQRVFNGLDRTMKCHWDGATIVVAGTTRISAPYTADVVTAPSAVEAERVRRILANLRV